MRSMLFKDVDHRVGTGRVVGLQPQSTVCQRGQVDQYYQNLTEEWNDFDLVERRASVA